MVAEIKKDTKAKAKKTETKAKAKKTEAKVKKVEAQSAAEIDVDAKEEDAVATPGGKVKMVEPAPVNPDSVVEMITLVQIGHLPMGSAIRVAGSQVEEYLSSGKAKLRRIK